VSTRHEIGLQHIMILWKILIVQYFVYVCIFVKFDS
jgi:hypothetical protein